MFIEIKAKIAFFLHNVYGRKLSYDWSI